VDFGRHGFEARHDRGRWSEGLSPAVFLNPHLVHHLMTLLLGLGLAKCRVRVSEAVDMTCEAAAKHPLVWSYASLNISSPSSQTTTDESVIRIIIAMDDLSGLSFNNVPPKPSPAPTNAFSNLSLKPSPLSSRTTSPAGSSAPQNGAASKKSGDTFSNLVPFGRDKQTSNLSLLEQQKLLEEQRRRDAEESQRKMDALFGGGARGVNNGFWDSLSNGGSSSPAAQVATRNDDEDDLLAAFNSSAPVDTSSHYPPPPSSNNSQQHQNGSAASSLNLFDDAPARRSDPLLDVAPGKATSSSSDPFDPFDVANLPSRDPSPFPASHAPQTQDDDDFDILGDLAKPVSELPPRPPPEPTPPPKSVSPPPSADPRDPAIAEIMDMGFTAEQAKRALAETDTGLDVQMAVSWLLEEAHRNSRPTASASSSRQDRPRQSRQDSSRSRTRGEQEREDNMPAWARGGRSGGGEKDLGAIAAEMGGNLFKSANNLWSTGRKKMERAVAEFKAEMVDPGDPNQPKWMRERQIREELEKRGARGISRSDRPPVDDREQRPATKQEPEITDEALMLEMGTGPPPPRRKHREERAAPAHSRDPGLSEKEQIQRQRMHEMEEAIREKEREMRERERARAVASSIPDSASRKAKLAAETEPVYVSRNRRRPPPASSSKPSTSEPDLLGGGGAGGSDASSLNPFAKDVAAQQRQRSPQPQPRAPAPAPRRPPPKQRPTVPISPSALSQSNAARQKGTEAFKRGDYAEAQTLYTSALVPIPETHTLRIILLANRSLCTLKLGDPKSAIVDVDAMLALIGDSRGEAETIALDGAEKDMKEYWTKAITRKAECLEQMEKWADAKAVWEEALTGGGNQAAINGKRRCEAALRPKALPKAAPPPPKRPSPSPSAKLSGAVTALRQANADQERQDAERLALHDVVNERIGNWKNGKEGNLRALLAGLDTVLWEGSGWKKVGMGELLVPNKCKIAYMKGIAKVHPDKVCFSCSDMDSFGMLC
jgi:tetratricopeptide (TPR) repeat protein